jgi:hypothetical protein
VVFFKSAVVKTALFLRVFFAAKSFPFAQFACLTKNRFYRAVKCLMAFLDVVSI